MSYSPVSLFVCLISYYGIMEAHVADIHPITPAEVEMEDKYKREKENEAAEKTLNDDEASPEEKGKALYTLSKNGVFA